MLNLREKMGSRSVRFTVAAFIASLGQLVASAAPAAAEGPKLPSWLPKPNGYDNSVEKGKVVKSTDPKDHSQGGVSPNLYGIDETATCSGNSWNAVQAVANGLVIGNCPSGGTLYTHVVDSISNPSGGQSPYFDGGYVGGNFNGCGWMNENRLTNFLVGNPVSNCTNPDHSDKRDYVYCSTGLNTCPASGANLFIWTGPNGNDGVAVTNKQDCKEYANYRPWLSGQTKNDDTGAVVPANSNGRLLLRYVAKYQVSGTSAWVAMVHDPYAVPSPWSFVPWSCITG